MKAKRLFVVRVEFEYAVMAEDALEAERSSELAEYELRIGEASIHVTPACRNGFRKPAGWDDNECGVYTGPRARHDTITWAEAVIADKAVEA